MAGGAYDGGKTLTLDKDPTKEIQHSIAKSRQEVALAIANLNQSGSRDLLGIIQSLIGKPIDFDDMYEEFENWVKGIWQPIQDLYDNFEEELGDFLSTWNISLGSLSPIAPNLQIAPEINSEYNVAGNGRWIFDPAIGDPSAGSFKMIGCNGKEQAVTGTPIQVVPGQHVEFSVKFKWFGLTYTGNPLQLRVREIDTGKTVYLNGVVSPGTNGGFVEVKGTYITPGDGVTRVKIRPTIDASATAGIVWIDSGAARKTGVIQQDWVQDLVSDFNDTWDAITGIFEAFGSINNEGDFQNAIGKLLSLFGIEHPDDLGSMTQAQFWSAIWVSFMKPLGLIAPQLSLDEANKRQMRMAENTIIVMDLLHWFYPEGSKTDTPTTTINGKRTWWAAYNDIAMVRTEAGPGTAEATAAPLQINQRIIDAEDTISTVQAQVAELIGDQAEGGRNFRILATGDSDDWGAAWTLSGNGTVKTDLGAFAWDVQTAFQSTDKYIDALYNAGELLTDDGIVGAITIKPIKSIVGANGPYYRIKGRANAAGNDFLFADAYYSKIVVGYCVGGVETVMATVNGITVPAGGLFELIYTNWTMSVRVNGRVIPGLTWTDTAHASKKDSSHRKGGQRMYAARGTFGDQFDPTVIRTWILKDQSTITNVYGSTARFYRGTTVGVTKNRGVTAAITTETFDTIEYCSPDIQLLPGGLVFQNRGAYRIQFTARFNVGINDSKAAAIIKNGSGIYAEEMTMAGLDGGLSGNFLIPAAGNGTEAWYPGLDVSGSGTYQVVGDGGGLATWLTVERVA